LAEFLQQTAIPLAEELEYSNRVYVKWNGTEIEVRPGVSCEELVETYKSKDNPVEPTPSKIAQVRDRLMEEYDRAWDDLADT